MRYILPITLLTIGLVFIQNTVDAQGNTCMDPIIVHNPQNYCSGTASYNTAQMTPGNYDPSTCFTGNNKDIWFAFTAVATTATITVRGETSIDAGGTMVGPQAAMYSGDCGGTLSELQCVSDAANGDNIIEFTRGGLFPGITYFIRIQSVDKAGGSFQLCINNFNPPVEPGSDCITAAVLCDKSSFTVKKVSGAGNDIAEMKDATCFFNGSPGLSYETSSTWFKWTCKTSGTLEFTLTTLNKTDDLDFVLYELPMGLDNCSEKVLLRCMAAGDFIGNYPSPCFGPTGLRAGHDDISEAAGCMQGQDNFIAPAHLEAGKSYALIVNNYSDSGNGFLVEWGGTAEFLGPEPDIEIVPTDNKFCYLDPITIKDASSNATGEIVSWDWYFGANSSPSTATGQGPHTINYSKAGTKIISLRIKSDRGCVATYTDTIKLNCCEVPEKVDIGPDVYLNLGESYQFHPEVSLKGTEYEYTWTPDTTLTCYTCPDPIASPVDDTVRYTLRVEDEFGCSAIDEATIYVKITYPIYAPSAFTPNGDGVNDYYTLFSNLGAKEIYILEIFNRWGDKVFSRSHIPAGEVDFGWDGKIKGMPAQEGTYVFRAVVEFLDNKRVPLTGTITVLR